MKNMWKSLLFLVIIAMGLTGCAYKNDKMVQQQIPYEDQIVSVQMAVDRFQADNGGILPIKTKVSDTPIYQKYLIDFKRLVPKYLAEAPSSAFESGGVFQYTLIDVETKPLVKIFDLRIAEEIRDLNLRIKMQGYPPFKERIATGVYSLDFKKLGYKEDPIAVSPYSNKELPYIVTDKAEIYVDYRQDLAQMLQTTRSTFLPGEDIRVILHEDSNFVPAFSLPYTIDPDTNEPIFLIE